MAETLVGLPVSLLAFKATIVGIFTLGTTEQFLKCFQMIATGRVAIFQEVFPD